MIFSNHELGAIIHGIFFGGIFLLSSAVGTQVLLNLYAFKRLRGPKLLFGFIALASWTTVLLGTYLIYPWYREDLPESPRSRLIADPVKVFWHSIGMEWKEHLAWTVPILVSAAAFLVIFHGEVLKERREVRNAVFWIFLGGFVAAIVSGVLGALINKAAPFI